MKTVRQFSRVGPCIELGPLIRETDTRIYYRYRQGYEAFVSKKSSLAVHLEPCPSCRDHQRSQYPDAIETERGASCSSQMPHDGVIFIAGRSRRGSQKLVWAVMAITAIATDVRINAREVPKPIRRRAYELFEGDRNRNRTPEPVASLPKQEGTVQWKRTDQSSNRSRPPTDGRSTVKRDLFEEVEGRP